MKNQMMKSKRGDKNHHFKILQGESQKLKDKLETLKEQIKLKKQQKIMNTTSPSINPYTTHKKLTQAKMNQTNYSQKQDKRLNHLLADLKIQNIEQKLKDRHIYQIQQLFGLKDEEIDNWKDVGVGYRIKLKKFIEKNRGKEVNLSNIDVNEKGEMHNIEMNSKNIEEIIKNRNNDKYYVPINRQQQQIQHDYPPQLTQYEQEKMMLSILSFLGGKERSTSIKSKKTEKSSSRKHVHWSKEVQQLQSKKNQQKKYPKEIISKKILTQKIESIESPINKSQQMQQQWNNKRQIGECQGLEYPDYRYCWSCLKRIIKQIMRLDEKQFCSCQCLQKYQQTVNPVNLLYQFEQTQLKYNAFVESKDDANEEQSLDLDIV